LSSDRVRRRAANRETRDGSESARARSGAEDAEGTARSAFPLQQPQLDQLTLRFESGHGAHADDAARRISAKELAHRRRAVDYVVRGAGAGVELPGDRADSIRTEAGSRADHR